MKKHLNCNDFLQLRQSATKDKIMYALRIDCQDPDGTRYFDTGVAFYPSYDKALLTAYSCALAECADLNLAGNENGNYFEVEEYQEYPDYENCDVSDKVYPVSVAWFDKPCTERENDLQYRMVSGYEPVEVGDVELYNSHLRKEFGEDVTARVELKFDPDDGTPWYHVKAKKAEFEPCDTAFRAFCVASAYLRSL